MKGIYTVSILNWFISYLFYLVIVVFAYGKNVTDSRGLRFEWAQDNFVEYAVKRPMTGFYANTNTQRSIVIEGCFLGDPPGGVEALVQLSLALKEAAWDSKEVYVTDNNYHSRWRDQYQDKLIMSVKRIEDLKKGDVYIYSEGMACVHNIPEGVYAFVFILANYMGCKPSDHMVRYLSHNQYLSSWTYHGQGDEIKKGEIQEVIKLPPERIIHPYMSPYVVERAFHNAGLQHDGLIIYERSFIKTKKRKLILLDDDVLEEVKRAVERAASKHNAEVKVLNGMGRDELLNTYEEAMIVIDWCMRGSERCPLEAALFGAIAITNKCATGLAFADFPIPGEFLINSNFHNPLPNQELEDIFTNKFDVVFKNYWDILPDYEPMRRMVLEHNPLSMVKEAVRFLATVDIDENANKNLPQEKKIIDGDCHGCRKLRGSYDQTLNERDIMFGLYSIALIYDTNLGLIN